jgi:hypothetical protein
MEKINQDCLIFIDIFVAFLLIFLVVLSGLNIDLLNKGFYYLNDITNNWNRGMIMDFTLVNDSCPESYELFVNQNFPGTVKGCDCTDSLLPLELKSYYGGSCPVTYKSKLCKDIPSNHSKQIEWKNSSICVKRSQEYNYNNLVKYLSNKSCENDTIFCGKIDNMDNSLCLPSDQSCPIVDYYFNSNRHIKYSVLELDQLGEYLLYTNDSKISQNNYRSFVDLIIGSEIGICLDKRQNASLFYDCLLLDINETIKNSNEKVFTYNYTCDNNLPYQSKVSNKDQDFSKIDSLTLNNFLIQNGIDYDYINGCSKSISSSRSSNLYGRKYIGLKYNILKEDNFTNILEIIFKSGKFINIIRIFNEVFFYCLIGNLLFFGLFCVVLKRIKIINNELNTVKNISIVFFTFNLIFLILFWTLFGLSFILNDKIKLFANSSPGSDNLNNFFLYYSGNFNSFTYNYMWMGIISFIVVLGYLCNSCLIKPKDKKNHNYIEIS